MSLRRSRTKPSGCRPESRFDDAVILPWPNSCRRPLDRLATDAKSDRRMKPPPRLCLERHRPGTTPPRAMSKTTNSETAQVGPPS
jgi:hypothetical protein